MRHAVLSMYSCYSILLSICEAAGAAAGIACMLLRHADADVFVCVGCRLFLYCTCTVSRPIHVSDLACSSSIVSPMKNSQPHARRWRQASMYCKIMEDAGG